MKKTVQRIIHICDHCGNEDVIPNTCLKCGKQFCLDCAQKHAVSYSPLVGCSGSSDGLYCKPCDARLARDGNDQLHTAYRAIASLQLEGEAWNRDFRNRSQAAEELVRTHSANEINFWQQTPRGIRVHWSSYQASAENALRAVKPQRDRQVESQ
jgi:hypothetical protein